MTIGELFKEARLNSGLNLREASELIGMHHSTLHKIESGAVMYPNIYNVGLLCKFYNIPVDSIFKIIGV